MVVTGFMKSQKRNRQEFMVIAIFMTQAEMTLGPDALDIVPAHFLTSDTATYLKACDEYLVSLWATIVVVCMPKLCTQK